MKLKHIYLLKNAVFFTVMALFPHSICYWLLLSSIGMDVSKFSFKYFDYFFSYPKNLASVIGKAQRFRRSFSLFSEDLINPKYDKSVFEHFSLNKQFNDFLISSLIISVSMYYSVSLFLPSVLVFIVAYIQNPPIDEVPCCEPIKGHERRTRILPGTPARVRKKFSHTPGKQEVNNNGGNSFSGNTLSFSDEDEGQ
jgi:hypothetical protein